MVSRGESIAGFLLYLLGVGVSIFGVNLTSLTNQLLLFLGVSAIVVIVQGSRWYTSTVRLDKTRHSKVVEELIQALLRKYKDDFGHDCHLRSNVMVPVEKRPILSKIPVLGLGKTRLQFKDHAGGYSEAELEQSYRKGQGTSGLAWERRKPVVYDEDERPEPDHTLSATHRDVTSHIKSILSVPVFLHDHAQNPICVLNLDSEDHLDETHFDEDRIQASIEEHADVIASTIEEKFDV